MTTNPATQYGPAAADERPIREQYADELRDDPFYLPGVDDYDDGHPDETDDYDDTEGR